MDLEMTIEQQIKTLQDSVDKLVKEIEKLKGRLPPKIIGGYHKEARPDW